MAGLVGGIAIALVMGPVAAVRGENLWVATKVAAYPFLGDRVMAPGFDAAAVLVGLLSHFAVSIVWGVLFALVAFGLSRAATPWAGAVWGILVWIGMFYIVLPVVGASAIARATPVGRAIIEHVLFGLAVGLGFVPYQRPHARSGPWWRAWQPAARGAR